jgi:hypothetical protein
MLVTLIEESAGELQQIQQDFIFKQTGLKPSPLGELLD